MAEEWGPWIEHDGKHLPPQGARCQATFCDGDTLIGTIVQDDYTQRQSFLWGDDESISHVVRYRVRKPRALLNLIDMVENLPVRGPVDA
jgi:hypothetical protein